MFNSLKEPSNKPQLVITVEPTNKVRFRYASEKGSHGTVAGSNSTKKKKTFPTVKLINFHGNKDVTIRVSLYTQQRIPHVLELKTKTSWKGFVYEDLDTDNCAVFSSLVILSKKKDEVFKILMERKLASLKLNNLTESACKQYESRFQNEINKEAKEILNSAVLCFEALFKNKINEPICPKVFSEVIYNQRTTACNDLRIHRMSRVAGSWKGDDEVILLCDKVKKECIKVIFFEKDADDEIIWQGEGKFTQADIHYQCAITFKTPAYRDNISKEVSVCLRRNDDFSEPVAFTYIPDDENMKKRRRICAEHVEQNSFSEQLTSFPPPFSAYQNVTNPTPSTSSNETSLDNVAEQLSQYVVDNNCSNSNLDVEDFDKFFPKEIIAEILKEEDNPNYGFGTINFEDLALPFDSYLELPETNDIQIDGPPDTFPQVHNQCLDLSEFHSSLPDLSDDEFSSEEIADDEISTNQTVKAMGQMAVFSIPHKRNLANYLKLLSMKDKNGNNMLHLAVNSLKLELIQKILLMNKLAKSDLINEKNGSGQTPLHLAVLQKNNSLVKRFCEEGGNPNIKDENGDNCFHIASENDSKWCLLRLLDTGCLSYSSSKKPEIDAFNYEGLTPLHLAIKNNSKSCVPELIKVTTDINIREQKSGRSVLHMAVEMKSSCIQILLDNENIDVNIENFEGNTPLHLACANGFIDMAQFLLDAGADISLENYRNTSTEDDVNSHGETPEDLAIGHPEILKLLKKKFSKETEEASDGEYYECSSDIPKVFDALVEEELCKILDPPNNDWKTLGMYIGMEDQLMKNIEENYDSPTKALLTCLRNQNKENFVNIVQNALEMAGLSSALKLIEEKKL